MAKKKSGNGKSRGTRRSRAESMTEAKANEVEMRTAGIGDNSGDVQDQAYQRGFKDAESGRGASNPYPESSDLADLYANGWRHGTAKNLGLTPEQSDAAIAGQDTAQIAAE